MCIKINRLYQEIVLLTFVCEMFHIHRLLSSTHMKQVVNNVLKIDMLTTLDYLGNINNNKISEQEVESGV